MSAVPQSPERIGLIAGWGRFPIVTAEALKRQGHAVYCLGLEGHADPVLRDICDDFQPAGVAKLGFHIRYFRRHDVHLATMAGKLFKHKLLFGGFWGAWRLLPDFRTVRACYPMFIRRKKNRSDDTLLGVAVEEFARDGIRLAPAVDFAPELLVKQGQLTRRGLSAAEWADVCFAWPLAKEMGRLDIGQSVAVKGRAVLAVEAVEGTDECIRRAGSLCRQGGFTVVKVAKPQQDMRFDVPAIGLGTIETLHAAGARVLAIEAEKTIVIDQADVVRMAEKLGITIQVLTADEMERAAAA